MYIIKQGDTLSALAKRYNTTVERLARDNSIDDPNKIKAGHMIVLPDGAGESFWAKLRRIWTGK